MPMNYKSCGVFVKKDEIKISPKISLLPSYQRVLQDDVSTIGQSAIALFSAKNETASFQVLVSNMTQQELNDVSLQISSWSGSGTTPEAVLYKEHYVHIEQNSNVGISGSWTTTGAELGWYPDALIPFNDPYTGQPISPETHPTAIYFANNQSVAAGKSQLYWVDVNIGTEVQSGTFGCFVLVYSGDDLIASLPIRITVWDFTLPDTKTLKTWFGGVYYLDTVYGYSASSEEYATILQRHKDMLFSHNIYPIVQKGPSVNMSTGEVSFTQDFIAALTESVANYGPAHIRTIGSHFTALEDESKLIQYLSDYEEFNTTHSELGPFAYYVDEPSTEDRYALVQRVGEAIQTYAPSIQFLVTLLNPLSADISDLPTIQCVFFRELVDTRIDLYRVNNPELWFYTAQAFYYTGKEVPYWQIDTSLFNYRAHAWCGYAIGGTGLLYWKTTTRTNDYDSWTNPISHTSGGHIWNGEGLLMYKGTEAGLLAPISTTRLKMIRDSIRDYEYFKLLEQALGSGSDAIVEGLVNQVATDFTTYSKDPLQYETIRQQIAEMIVQNS